MAVRAAMAILPGPDRFAPLEVQRAALRAAGVRDDEIDLASAERELAEIRLHRAARARDAAALQRIADREDEFDALLALARGLNAAVRDDPDCDGYLLDADGAELTSESFGLAAWLAERLEPFGGIDTPLLDTVAGRRALTECDPLLFALVYLPHHLKTVLPGQAGEGVFSFADFHLDVCRRARPSVRPSTETRGPRDCYVAPRSTGKALALDTPVLTANRGWTTHGDLAVGDSVFDENGRQCRVVAISPRWEDRPCYKLTFSDGEQIVADVEHEWFVSDRWRTSPGIQTTEEIADKWLLPTSRDKAETRYSIPVCGPLNYPDAELPIPPYVLGLWLGDGNSDGGRITAGEQDAADLVAFLAAEGENPNVTRPPSQTALSIQLSKPRPHLCPREHVLRADRIHPDSRSAPCQVCVGMLNRQYRGGPAIGPRTNRPLLARLRDSDLLKNKHIPEIYFTASREQRLALLQGLVDSDGYVAPSGACEITGVNERLCREVLRLARSLGIKATMNEGRATIGGVDKGPKWRILFQTALPVARLPRKLDRLPARISQAGTRQIINVERVESQTTSCIQVDSPSHLYLVGETLIPTHNSTWHFLLLAMWEAAHGHETFTAAFADSATQAEIHLMTFRQELENNELLRRDFPDLCKPAVKLRAKTDSDGTVKESGLSLKDNEAMYIASSGFIFAARGVDTKTLGLKVNERRPSKLLLDDVEPDESNYSQDQVAKRLRSIIDAILPLNLRARVTIVGTVVMPGSIIHQLVEFERYPETEETPETAWIREQAIRVHYYAPIIDTFDPATGQTGRRSIWPAKWPLAFLESLEQTRDYLKNFANDPMGSSGTYWTVEDFGTHRVSAELQAQTLAAITHQLLAIDPAVTTKKRSDFTALAVVGFSAVTRRCVIRDAWAVRVQAGQALCALIERIVAQYPQIRGLVIESNQGGELWLPILGDLGLPIETVWHSEPKEVRAARFLDKYQRGGRVFHERPLRALEANMVVFPRGRNDDLVDAAGTGAEWFLDRPAQRRRGGGTSVGYT